MLYKLESLRGIAACMVILFHSPFSFNGMPTEFFLNSYLFVDFFFVLSGFVMTLAYGPRITEGLNFKSYLILRLGRVYPLHLIMLFIWVPFIFVKHYLYAAGHGGEFDPFEKNNLGSFITNVLLIHSMGVHDYLSWNLPSWSISTEFFAYIMFYLITVLIDKRQTLIVPVIVAIVCYGIIASLGRNTLDITYDYGFFRCLGAFYLGVFIYRFSERVKLAGCFINHMATLEMCCVASILVSVSFSRSNPLFIVAVIMSFVLAIYIFSQEQSGFIGKLLLTNPFRKVGLWSYSVYMLHEIVVSVFSNVFQYILKWDLKSPLGYQSLLVNIVMVSTIILLSKYSFQFIELVFRRKSRLLAEKFNPSIQTAAKAAAD